MNWARPLLGAALAAFAVLVARGWWVLAASGGGEARWMLAAMAVLGTLACAGGVLAWWRGRYSLAASALLLAPLTPVGGWLAAALAVALVGLVVIAFKPVKRPAPTLAELEGEAGLGVDDAAR
ncbi:hypothetical protein ABYF32_07730 [Buchananella felis]|uniref:hypothetical protein n=1 Tax=Buchananella felis TaxID=3231492 RepID=UPI0035296CB8